MSQATQVSIEEGTFIKHQKLIKRRRKHDFTFLCLAMQSYRDVLFFHESRTTCIQSTSATTIHQRLECSEKLETTVRQLDLLNERIQSFLDSECLQAENTDALALRLKHSRSFPAIRRKLLATRLLPYECNFGLLLCMDMFKVPPILNEAVDHRAVNIAAVPALQALQSRSSKFVLKMLTTISEEIPFCKEEVEAASNYLNSRFNNLNARIKSITSIQDTNPSRWPFHHFWFVVRNKAMTAHNRNDSGRNQGVLHPRQSLRWKPGL